MTHHGKKNGESVMHAFSADSAIFLPKRERGFEVSLPPSFINICSRGWRTTSLNIALNSPRKSVYSSMSSIERSNSEPCDETHTSVIWNDTAPPSAPLNKRASTLSPRGNK